MSSPGLTSNLCHFFVARKFLRLIFMLAVLYFYALGRDSKLLRVANEHFFGITPYSSISQNSGQDGRQCRTPVPYTICLLCGTSLVGDRCMFNVLQHVGLLRKMERLLDDQLNTNVQSSRVCRPCGRKVESLAKKEVLTEQLKLLRPLVIILRPNKLY